MRAVGGVLVSTENRSASRHTGDGGWLRHSSTKLINGNNNVIALDFGNGVMSKAA